VVGMKQNILNSRVVLSIRITSVKSDRDLGAAVRTPSSICPVFDRPRNDEPDRNVLADRQ
jgi:hypothetical protein